MKTIFKMSQVREAIKTENDIAFVHDDGTYLLIDETVVKPIKGGWNAGEGDDFVEHIPVTDVTIIPKDAIDLIIELTADRMTIGYTVKQKKEDDFKFEFKANDENEIIANWWLDRDYVKRELGIRVKCESHDDHRTLKHYNFGELYWDYEEGLKFATTDEQFPKLIEFIKKFHADRDIPLAEKHERVGMMSMISANFRTGGRDIDEKPRIKLFESLGLVKKDYSWGFPTEAPKADKPTAKANFENTTGQTTRKLTLEPYEDGKYAGVFTKEVKGEVKIDAMIQIKMEKGKVVLTSSRDRIRDKSFPADTRQSIEKQINELCK